MWLLHASIVLGVSLAAWRTHAQEAPSIAIAWSVDSGAESTSDVAAACEKPANMDAEVLRLASSIPSRAAARFEVRLQALSGGRYLLRVSSSDAPVARSRELGSCQEAREAAALIVAMALGLEESQPSAVASGSEREAQGEHSISAEMGVPTRITLTILALLDLGTLPGIGVGPAFDLGVASGLLRLGLAAHYLPPRDAPGIPATAKIRLSSYALRLHGAALFRFGRTAFGPRAELELGALRGMARGVEDAVTRTAWRAALLGGLALELWLHPRVGLQLAVLAGSPLGRPRFALEDNAARYTTSALIVRAALGMTVWIDPKD